MSGAIAAGAIAAGIGAAGSIGSAAIGANAAGNAASKQMQAAQQAAQLQQQGSTNALNYQNGIYGQTQQNLNPYINAGGGALNNLSYLLGVNPTSNSSMVQGAQGLNLSPTSGAASPVPRIGSSLPGGISPSGGPSLPNSPTANPVGVGQTLAGSQVAPSQVTPSADGRTFSGGMVPRANPIANPAAGADGGGSLAGAGSPSLGTPGGAQGGFGSLTQGYGQTFQAPTNITEQNDPGYQARLQMGTDAIQRSAAARGGVLTGGTGKALDSYAQDYASNEYGNVYNRALTGFGTNYGVWNNDNNNIYNRLMGLSNQGQQAATNLGSFGQQSANNVTQNLLGTGQQIGQDYGAGAAANASGIVGGANAWSGGLSGASNNISQLLLLKQLGLGGGGYGGPSFNSNGYAVDSNGNPYSA